MYRENRLKKRLAAGKKALGGWLAGGDPVAAEIMALAGYDFLMIDHEHGFADLASAVRVLQALSATETTALVRVPWNDPVYIKRALDVGAEGIMVPMIQSAEEARAAVAACRFPPAGIRGAATTLVRATDYGLSEAEYLRTIDDNLLILCQIETVKAVENVEAIAAVDGVDVLFIGPADIAADMGFLDRRERPEVRDMLARAEAAIKATGKHMGTVPREGCGPRELFDLGYDLVSGGSEVSLLREAARAQVAAHRARYG